MSIKKQPAAGFRPSALLCLTVIAVPVLLWCNQISMIRVDLRGQVEHCFADAFGFAGITGLAQAGCVLLFLLLTLSAARYDFRPPAVIRSGGRKRIFLCQSGRIVRYALFFAVYVTAVAAALGALIDPEVTINWDTYAGRFFFENQYTVSETLPHIVFLFFCTWFFTLLFTGLLGLAVRWLSKKNVIPVLVFLLLYMPDTTPLNPVPLYYGITSFTFEQWTRYPAIDLILPVQAVGVAAVWLAGLLAARRKDFYNE